MIHKICESEQRIVNTDISKKNVIVLYNTEAVKSDVIN